MSSESSSNRPSNSAFKQQTLPAWQPILTPHSVIPTFAVVGIIFIIIGALLYVASQSVVEASVNYTNCKLKDAGDVESCELKLEVSETMQKPVYVYYELENFYQNHRRYVQSRSDAQLRGEKLFDPDDLSDCAPRIGKKGTNSKPDQIYVPCGLIAWSRFNDSFYLEDPNGDEVKMPSKGIAWKSDVEDKFKEPDYSKGIHIMPSEEVVDERFIVWMRTAGLPHFRKLYGIIDKTLEKGTYDLTVANAFPVAQFGGKKSFVLSTTSWAGGKNDFLGLAYIVVGSVCIVLCIAFGVANVVKPRKLGDQSFLVWQ